MYTDIKKKTKDHKYSNITKYSWQIRGAEGRAGMAAIYDENGTLDVNKLASDIKEQLPAYSRPQFVRILTKIDLTGISIHKSILVLHNLLLLPLTNIFMPNLQFA